MTNLKRCRDKFQICLIIKMIVNMSSSILFPNLNKTLMDLLIHSSIVETRKAT